MKNQTNWYGWIPILTNKLTISIDKATPTTLSTRPPHMLDWSEIISDQSSFKDISDFLKLFINNQQKTSRSKEEISKDSLVYIYKASLTDNWFELKRGVKHPISISIKKKGKHIAGCPSCSNETVHLEVSIYKPFSHERIISSDVYIHTNGLTLYKLKKDEYSKHFLVNQIHKIVRDIFHSHIHHRSDLLLPTTLASSDIEALCCFQKSYVSKFLAQKKLIKHFTTNQLVRNYPEAIKLIALAKGELLYAQNLINHILPPQLAEKKFFFYIEQTLRNFEKYIENKKSSFFTLSRIGLSICALSISSVVFFTSEVSPDHLYLAKYVCGSLVALVFACGIAFGSRFINTYRHKCFSRIFSMFY